MYTNRIPDGWQNCPPFGNLVGGLFLPMKTLLDDHNTLPLDCKFTPDTLVEQFGKKKINIGLVINLTFTTRYYDSDELLYHEIDYKQITCRGFNEAPQPKERAEFIKVCNSFLAKNPNKIIGVHCTHGFNRTGFMICLYLCSERDWAVDAAVAHFASSRPPGIYKQEYINELFNLFGDSDDDVPKAPTRPSWDSENGQMASQHDAANKKEFYEGITDVHLVSDPTLKHRIYSHCCSLCNYNVRSNSISFPGAQPVSMDMKNLHLLRQHQYRVSWKADGCRYMMYIQDEGNMFFLTRSLDLWRINGLKFPKIDDLNCHLTDTLVDGEMVTDIYNGQKIPRYLIYDVISLNGKILNDHHFDKRCGLIKCVIVEARRRAKQANIISSQGEPFKIGDKGFFYIQDTKRTWNLKVTHEKDGLIFQPVNEPYTGGTCPGILKWKPPSHNSIDFRLVIREERRNGCLPETVACLHVSDKADPIQSFRLGKDQSNYHQYNNKIVEMTRVNNKWVVMRERTDKLHPNSSSTASATWHSIQNPVTEKYLFEYIASIPPEPKR